MHRKIPQLISIQAIWLMVVVVVLASVFSNYTVGNWDILRKIDLCFVVRMRRRIQIDFSSHSLYQWKIEFNWIGLKCKVDDGEKKPLVNNKLIETRAARLFELTLGIERERKKIGPPVVPICVFRAECDFHLHRFEFDSLVFVLLTYLFLGG